MKRGPSLQDESLSEPPSTLSESAGASGLLPCPFCGKSDAFVERSDFVSAYATCNHCCARGPIECQDGDDEETPGRDAAVVGWNTRAAPVQAEPVQETPRLSERLWFHGTNREASQKIAEHGFVPSTWFARSLEDAIEFGGEYVFAVALSHSPVVDGNWQMRVDDAIPASDICTLIQYDQLVLLNNPERFAELSKASSSIRKGEPLSESSVQAEPVAWRWRYRTSSIWNVSDCDVTSATMCAPEFIIERLYASPPTPVLGEAVAWVIPTYFGERRSEFERNGVVVYHQPSGEATMPLYATPVSGEVK